MKVNQGLLNWLNAVNHNDNDAGQTKTGLLLAPIDTIQQDTHEELNLIHEINEPVYDVPHEREPEIEIPIQIQESELEHEEYEPEPEPQEQEYELEPENEAQEQESESQEQEQESQEQKAERESQKQESEPKNESHEQELNTLIGIPEDVQNNQITEAEAITRELESLKNEVDSLQQDTARTLDLNKAWHEASSGLELSMKEPPPQIWSSQNENESEDEASDNDNEDYEHIILQQNSSVILHGTNFTQRLQRTLQGRKSKAAELKRKSSEDRKYSHPYIRHAFMMCSVMLLALGLAWLSLRYIQTKTPDSFNTRASELYEQGRYDEAMNLWQEAYNRYPNDIRFIEGIARSAEKAGHKQTANIAWDEYRNSLPEDGSKDREPQPKSEPLKININTGGGKKESKKESKNEAEIQQTESREPLRIMTFDDYLNEANRLYNIGMYTRALVNFMKALEMRNDDIRPYIGLAESYRARGIYFEARRILNEAESRFGRNPTIETLKNLLKGSN